MSLIFQALSQRPIFKPVENLRWTFFAKIVNTIKPLSIFTIIALFKDVRELSNILFLL